MQLESNRSWDERPPSDICLRPLCQNILWLFITNATSDLRPPATLTVQKGWLLKTGLTIFEVRILKSAAAIINKLSAYQLAMVRNCVKEPVLKEALLQGFTHY